MKACCFCYLLLSLSIFAQQTPPSPPADDQATQEAAAKKAQILEKNRQLNEAFSAAQTALKSAQISPGKPQRIGYFQTAIENFDKANQIDPKQPAVWDGLGEAYAGLADSLQGEDRTNALNHAIDNYQHGVSLRPNDGNVYNQIGNTYGKLKKLPEALDALQKAADLNPSIAPRVYFNMGATLVNNDQPDQGVEYFKKAIAADNNYAEAWYYYGATLLRSGTINLQTGNQDFPDDCQRAFTRYLELSPNGPNAANSKMIMAAMQEKAPSQFLPSPTQPSLTDPARIKLVAAQLLKNVEASYPPAAKAARIQGQVKLLVLVSPTGVPKSMTVISSPSSLLSIAAINTASQWRYKPVDAAGPLSEFFTQGVVNYTLSQ